MNEEKFAQVASTGDGPDIMFWAHDRFGGYAQSGLLAEVNVSKEFKDKFVDFAWDAGNLQRQNYRLSGCD